MRITTSKTLHQWNGKSSPAEALNKWHRWSLNPNQNPRPSAVVYFIQAGEFVKIGFSVNPESRIDELKTGCPFELKLLTTVPGGKKMEKELHQIFAAHRQHGEWFTFHQDIKDYIAKYL